MCKKRMFCVSAGRQNLHFGLSWRGLTELLQHTCWGNTTHTHTYIFYVFPGHLYWSNCVCEACRSCCCVQCGEYRSMWLCFRPSVSTHTPVTPTTHTSPPPSPPCYDSENSHRRCSTHTERFVSTSLNVKRWPFCVSCSEFTDVFFCCSWSVTLRETGWWRKHSRWSKAVRYKHTSHFLCFSCSLTFSKQIKPACWSMFSVCVCRTSVKETGSW